VPVSPPARGQFGGPVVQCIRIGIDNTPSAQITQQVHMPVWIFVHEEDSSHPPALPSNKDRSATPPESHIIFSVPSPLPSQLVTSIRNCRWSSMGPYPPCQPNLSTEPCRTHRRCAGPLLPQPVRVAPPHVSRRFARPPCVFVYPLVFQPRSTVRTVDSLQMTRNRSRTASACPARWPKPFVIILSFEVTQSAGYRLISATL